MANRVWAVRVDVPVWTGGIAWIEADSAEIATAKVKAMLADKTDTPHPEMDEAMTEAYELLRDSGMDGADWAKAVVEVDQEATDEEQQEREKMEREQE